MSEVGNPIVITPAVQVKVPLLPNQNVLVLDNLSTYALQVNVGGSVRWQAPLVEDAYPLGSNSAQVYVTPIALPNDLTTSGVITPTYYDESDLPGKVWPIALSGPAEVAAATAAALLNGGIPVVYQNVLLAVNNTFLGNPVPPGGTIDVPNTKYSTLIVIANCNPAAVIALGMDQHAAATVGAAGDSIISSQLIGSADQNNSISIAVPIVGGSTRFTNNSANQMQLLVYGDNRPSVNTLNTNQNDSVRVLGLSGAWTVNIPRTLAATDTGPASTSFNRQVWYSFTGGVIATQLYMQYVNAAGALDTVFVTACAANTSVVGTVPCPVGNVLWQVLPGATTAAAKAQLRLQQNILS